MQYIQIDTDATLSSLSNLVGSRNVQNVLSENDHFPRVRKIGEELQKRKAECALLPEVTPESKLKILNAFSVDSEIFEKAALATEDEWKIIEKYHHFNDAIKVPDSITLPSSNNVIGGSASVSDLLYRQTSKCLTQDPYKIDPSIFSTYNNSKDVSASAEALGASATVFQPFKFPWGKVRLYDAITDAYADFPVYPEEVSDSRSATYTTLGDILYEYEPWNIYTNSGPRSCSYSFNFHRQMWTGDERDGKANDLIRFCQACCYPEYNGSAVHTPTVKLFVEGQVLISGIMTSVNTQWSGPIGLDGWYLVCTLQLEITEVSTFALNHTSVRNIGTIG